MDFALQPVIARADLHARGLLAGDVALLAGLLDDTLVWTHSSGKVDNKESFLAPFRSGPSRYKAFERTIEKVRPFGDTVIFHGVVAITSQAGDSIRQISNRFIAVWTKTDGEWRLSAWQSTREPDAQV